MKAKTLYIVTAFIGKQGYKNRGPQLINAKSPNATSKNGSSASSINTISQNRNSVNDDKMQNYENNSDIRYVIDDTIPNYSAIVTTKDIEVLRSIERKSINNFTSEDIQKTEKWARRFYKELGTKSPFFRAWFDDWRAYDNNTVKTVNLNNPIKVIRGTVRNKDTDFNIDVSKIGIDHIKVHLLDSEFAQCIINNLHDITENAILLDTYLIEKGGKTKHKNTMFMHSFYAPVEYKGKKSIVKLFVEEYYNDWNDKTQRRVYDVKK